MKKIIIILIYSIISLILLSILSMPSKVEQEKFEAYIRYEMNSMRKISEEHWPDMPKEIREDALKSNENIIRDSYKSSNTFIYRFISNLKAFFIALVIMIVVSILRSAHRKELIGK